MAKPENSKRASRRVLVTQAESLGALAVIRSLGRAGYVVHASSHETSALGCESAFAVRSTLSPAPSSDGYADWLSHYVKANAIDAIVPSESVLLALANRFDEFSGLLPYSHDRGQLLAGMSKHELFKSLAAAPALPPHLLVNLDGELPDEHELELLGLPLFIKTDSVHCRGLQTGSVYREHSAKEALARLRALQPAFTRALVQGFVAGQGVGASFVRWNGKVLASFLHRRLHEVPYTGGASSLRESFVHEQILADARTKLESIDWQGPAMFEYRWNAESDRFALMEMNGRFWGSLHLALAAGVDFPKILVDAFFGMEQSHQPGYRAGVRVRHTFPADVQHCWSRLKARELGVFEKAATVARFGLLCLDPRVKPDLFYAGDRALYFKSLARFSSRAISIGGARWLKNL